MTMIIFSLVPSKLHDYSELISSARAGNSGVVPGLASPVSAGSLSEMQILRFRPRPTESETLQVWPSDVCFQECFRGF